MNYGKNILEYIISKKFRVRAYNIVYLEGCDPDTFKLNGDVLNYWNDVRMVIKNDGTILHCVSATTEPGDYYTYNPINSKGAARIWLGKNNEGYQYKDAWTFGDHKGQDALVQIAPIIVCRDFNKDGSRVGDNLDEGLFGINQHTTSNAPDTVGLWSAGCLVGRYLDSHAKFMRLCRNSGNNTFDTTVFAADVLKKEKVI